MSFLATIQQGGLPAHVASRAPRITGPLMAPAAGGYPRISLKGGRFTFQKDGEDKVCDFPFINASIVGALPDVSRQYYAGAYDPKAEGVTPDCFATDGRTPDAHAPNKQASACALCPHNQKGSGQGNSKACQFKKRLFIWSDFEPSAIYTLDVGAMGLFGDGIPATEQMNLQQFSKSIQNYDPSTIVTEIEFDRNASVPKLVFKPTDWWKAEELAIIDEVTDACADAIEAQRTIVSLPAGGGAPRATSVAPPVVQQPVAPAVALPPQQPAAPTTGRRGASAATQAAAPTTGRRGASAATQAAPQRATQAAPAAVVVDSVASEVSTLSGAADDGGMEEFLAGLN